jgi:hypothetical protein
MSETVLAVIVTAIVTLLASFGGQWLAHTFAGAQADAGRRHELRVAMREVVIEYVAAGTTLSHGMSMLLVVSRLGPDAAQGATRDLGGDFSHATKRFSDAEARIRMSVRDPDLLAPVNVLAGLYREMPARTSGPATTEMLGRGRASEMTVAAGLEFLREFDTALAQIVDAAVPVLADELGTRGD